MDKSGLTEIMRCSFCDKHEFDVRKLIAGPAVFICNECVDVCQILLADDEPSRRRPVEEEPSPAPAAESRSSPSTVDCSVCGSTLHVRQELLILRSGVLCPACVGEVGALLLFKRAN